MARFSSTTSTGLADFEEPVGGDDEEPEAVLGAEDKVAPAAVEVLAEGVEGDTLEDLLPF